jgi:hypothetical protein
MRAGEIRAAWFLHGLEFHQLDPRQIRFEEVQLPRAVFSHLRFLTSVRLPAMRFQRRRRFFHVGDPKRNMIQHTHQP